MRFFQPFNQNGLASTLAETRTHVSLSPGLIAIQEQTETLGYSAELSIPIPPSYANLSKKITLNFNLPQKYKNKALTDTLSIPLFPFYPTSIEPELSATSFEEYISSFLSLDDHHKQVFILPIPHLGLSQLKDVFNTECSFVILSGLEQYFTNQRIFTETIEKISALIPPDVALYLPGAISPNLYSFLIYSGIDFFDDSIAYLTARKGRFLTSTASYHLSHYPKCYCPHCRKEPIDLLNHNILVLKNTLSEVKFALENGTLRTIVERDNHNFPNFSASLRYYDKNYEKTFRKRTPIIRSSPLLCIGDESLYRPEVTEFKERVKTRYQPSKNAKILLLLPCSAKKPYSLSRSHLLFKEAIRKADKKTFQMLSELIITSPLSIVPRELENIYPAKYYDIPVSGEWSEQEIISTKRLLTEVYTKYPTETIVINHTHGRGYLEIVEQVFEDTATQVYHTAKDLPSTNYQSLSNLTTTIKEVMEKVKEDNRLVNPTLQKLRCLADYQYGKGTGEILFEERVKIKGRFPQNLQLFEEKNLVGTIVTATGFLSLTPEYAQKIIERSVVNLEFAGEQLIGSSIYAPGNVRADENILPNDEIFIIHQQRVLGTATALISGEDMNKMKSGILAIIKKKAKK